MTTELPVAERTSEEVALGIPTEHMFMRKEDQAGKQEVNIYQVIEMLGNIEININNTGTYYAKLSTYIKPKNLFF